MTRFLHGWHWKLGLVTLALSATFTILWIRSQSVQDAIQFASADRTYNSVISVLNWIEWHSDTCSEFFHQVQTRVKSPLIERKLRHSTNPLRSPESVRYFLYDGMQSSWCGFQFGYQHGSDIDSFIVLIPYSMIVIPLILLSAYLLISKPRQTNSSESAEPADKTQVSHA